MDNNGLHGLTLGSLFDGIGGFPLCAVLSGITPVWAAEVDAACVAVTKQRFPGMLHLGDISKIDGAKIQPVDIITFGSPCQDLSVAGKRAGIKHIGSGDEETTRSGLFLEAIRIIYEMRNATNGQYPTFIVWENVPGAFSSHNGNDFRTVLEEITKTDIPMPTSGKWASAGVVRGGAICAAWRLLDAQYWGVPQRRKRIYLVGSFGSNAAEEILFKRDRVRRYLASSGTPGKATSGNTQNCAGIGNIVFDCRGNGNGLIVPTITGDHNSRVTDYAALVIYSTGLDTYNQTLTGDVSKTLLARHQDADGLPCVVQAVGFQGQNSITASGVSEEYEKSPTLSCKKQANVTYALQGSMIGREDKNGPQGDGTNKNVCFTLNTADRHAVVYAIDRAAFNQGENAKYNIGIYDNGINPTAIAKGPSAVVYKSPNDKCLQWIARRLTPLECERLQGYPDNWTVLSKIEDMTDEEYEFFKAVFILDKTIKGKVVKNPPKKKSIVRWFNKLDVDAARYKQTGNSLAIPCALRVISYIADYVRGAKTNAE